MNRLNSIIYHGTLTTHVLFHCKHRPVVFSIQHIGLVLFVDWRSSRECQIAVFHTICMD